MTTYWLNVYPCMNVFEDNELVGTPFATREAAEKAAGPRRIALIPVTDEVWEATGITILEGDGSAFVKLTPEL
jgi:hypothetical protein